MIKSQFLKEILQIKDKGLLVQLEKSANIEKLKKGAKINEHRKTDACLQFLIQGLVKGYLVNGQGKENVACFLTKTGEIIAEANLLEGTSSEIRFLTLKETTVLSIPAQTMNSLRQVYREIDELYIRILSQWLLSHRETKRMLYLKTAKERYEWFLKN